MNAPHHHHHHHHHHHPQHQLIKQAVKHAADRLNQELLSAAIEGVSLKLALGRGPYRMGPTNDTERWWVRIEPSDDC